MAGGTGGRKEREVYKGKKKRKRITDKLVKYNEEVWK